MDKISGDEENTSSYSHLSSLSQALPIPFHEASLQSKGYDKTLSLDMYSFSQWRRNIPRSGQWGPRRNPLAVPFRDELQRLNFVHSVLAEPSPCYANLLKIRHTGDWRGQHGYGRHLPLKDYLDISIVINKRYE